MGLVGREIRGSGIEGLHGLHATPSAGPRTAPAGPAAISSDIAIACSSASSRVHARPGRGLGLPGARSSSEVGHRLRRGRPTGSRCGGRSRRSPVAAAAPTATASVARPTISSRLDTADSVSTAPDTSRLARKTRSATAMSRAARGEVLADGEGERAGEPAPADPELVAATLEDRQGRG